MLVTTPTSRASDTAQSLNALVLLPPGLAGTSFGRPWPGPWLCRLAIGLLGLVAAESALVLCLMLALLSLSHHQPDNPAVTLPGFLVLLALSVGCFVLMRYLRGQIRSETAAPPLPTRSSTKPAVGAVSLRPARLPMPQPTDAAPILLIQTAFIGDVILATALLERLYQAEPQTPVDVLVRRGNEGLLQGHPHVRRVLIWDKKAGKYRGLWQLLQEIRATGYGRVYNLQRFASTGLLTAFSGAEERVGFDKNPLSWAFTRRVPHGFAPGLHEVGRNLALLEPQPEGPLTRPRLYPTAADEAAAAQAASPAAGGPYVCIAPTSVWFTKQFPREQWVKLLRALPAQYTVFLLGGPPDTAECEALLQEAGRPSVINLSGKLSLLASAALMRGAVLNFVNDSAPMHLASAVDAPTCAVFCSTVPYFGFGPLSTFARIVELPEELACRPCGLHGYRKCPLGHFHCAHGIQTSQLLAVLAEAEQWAVQTAGR